MAVIVGAYPAYPSDPHDTERLIEGLAQLPEVGGLEVPSTGERTRMPPGSAPGWGAVITAIPATMTRMAQEPSFGLASPDSAGRRAAVELVRELRDSRLWLPSEGHYSVAVELQSAPRERADKSALLESLSEIAGWDWGATWVTLEHCDAWTDEHPVEKGFLSIEDELEVLEQVRRGSEFTRVGLTVNWGRSVIETRDAATGADHVRQAAEAGLLAGVMFSGAGDRQSDFGPAWADAHLPARELGAPASLLDADAIAATMAAAHAGGHTPVYVGLKIGLAPATLGVEERLERLRTMVGLVDAASTAAASAAEAAAAASFTPPTLRIVR